jgi:hypothetical protein
VAWFLNDWTGRTVVKSCTPVKEGRNGALWVGGQGHAGMPAVFEGVITALFEGLRLPYR